MSTAKMTGNVTVKLKAEIRKRVKRSGAAAKQLEEDMQFVAKHRGWEVLGYENFLAMYEGVNGHPAHQLLRNLVHKHLDDEQVTDIEIARMIGLPVTVNSKGYEVSNATSYIRRKRRAGIPEEKITLNADVTRDIQKYGDRARQQPRRMGVAHNERVKEGFLIVKEDALLANEMARESGISKSELYRKWVQPHIDAERLKRSRRTSRSRGKAA
jgi:hypothetical protein